MNIQAIGNFYQNNYVRRNNSPSFGQGSLIVAARSYYNPMRDAVDQTAFSTKRHLTDIEVCNRMLKGEANRFSQKEIADLNSALGTYRARTKKAPLLRELLDMKTPRGEKLEADDIIGFLYVTEGSTTKEQDALKTLLKYEMDEYTELNKRIFVPLENCPQMLGQLNKINKEFKNLPEEDRGQLMSLTFDVVKDSNFAYKPLSLDIAKTLNKGPGAYTYEILYNAAYALNNGRKQENSYKKFKTLLNSFTDANVKQMEKETAKFTSSDQEHEYVDNYLRKYDII